MEGFPGGAGLEDKTNSTGAAVFDASQYAFFGNDVVHEVELGGLEEEDDFHPVGFEDENFQLEREECEVVDSLSDIDDLASTFSKLNTVIGAPGAAGVIGSRSSGESSSAVEWGGQRPDLPNWFDQQVINADGITQDSKRWSSHPHSSDANFPDSKLLHRTSSYPEPQLQQHQHPHQHFSSEPILVPKTSFSSYPRVPYHPAGTQMPLSSPNLSPLSSHQFQLSASTNGSQFSGSLPKYNTASHSANSIPQNQWVGQANILPGDRSNLYNNLLPRPNGSMNPQLMPHRPNHPFQQAYGNLPGTQSSSLSHQFPPPPMLNKVENVLGWGDLRDQRSRSLPKTGQGYRYPQQYSDNRNGWPQFRSKYMSSDEIENILRMQLAATHSNDPYIDDYYHQACLAKNSSGAKLRHHFCPTFLKDPHGRANSEPHAYLHVDALGRVAFPSIRRPRPLLEVDPPNSSVSAEQTVSEKPLEQEPLLAARVAIEDGLCLLLNVDDIDRFMRFNPLQDGGAHLKDRRQALLDELAGSLQLIDPLGKNGHSVDLAQKDDLVFLRIACLPKGRKLLSKYLQLLVPNGELIRIVCMTISRHLRFLFGNPAADPKVGESTINLVKAVSSCVGKMELKTLSACLASVVCSSEHPPLRPIGSSAGDGASVILKSVLERATELLTNPSQGGNCSGPNRAFWQASFDSFFGLLTKYCFTKYDTVMQSLVMQAATDDMAVIGADAARAIAKEMPVDLLRASLPHTDENQRRVLMDFAQRSMPVNGSA